MSPILCFAFWTKTHRLSLLSSNFSTMAKLLSRRIVETHVVFFFVSLLLPLFLPLSSGETVMAPMEKTEQETLYAAIQGFVGPWWNGSELYPDPCGWTPIQGISCDLFDGFWYITIIDIGPVLDNSLECSPDARFTPFIFNLRHLRTLSFYKCFRSYSSTTLPSSGWRQLAGSLETLEFRSNEGLVGEIPTEIGLLSNLQSLVLVENGLGGSLPHELGSLVRLRRLSLARNRFLGFIPVSLGTNLNELLILDLSSNFLTGSIPSSVSGFTSLLKLDLSNNLLNESLPLELGNLKNLILLDLQNNSLSGGLIPSVQYMISLEDLVLSNNPLGGNLIDLEWKNLQNITNLDLSNASITGMIPESMAELKRLRFLALDNNNLCGSVPPKLAELPDLNALYLNGNNLTGEIGFSEEFFRRLGRRFGSIENENLCYRAGNDSSAGFLPFGMEKCREKEVNKLVDQGSHSRFMTSFGFQASSSSTVFWVSLVFLFMC
ncbi:Piriformospora indica-insensitive protein 2 [Apostasia shenzhenica]|uniref:Piriformospora indica-insensitive protein 2 n=1 Tax=Apostasia shenzhenica TaxID=1088818 RepID=A0A2I0AE86_9ASPA|nr:Piriformospora indica-insensitive protein 2 [Apostasia shenzhenica]